MVTFERVCELLDELGLNYHRDGDDEVAILAFSGAQVYVRLLEEGEAVVATSPYLLSVDEGPRRHQPALWSQIGGLNDLLKVGKLTVDPRDGEVSVQHFLPLEDAELTARQLHRLVRGVSHVAQREGELLRRVAYCGDGGLGTRELVEAQRRRRERRRQDKLSRQALAAPTQPCPDDLRDLLARMSNAVAGETELPEGATDAVDQADDASAADEADQTDRAA